MRTMSRYLISSLFLLVLVTSCSTEVELEAEWRDIPLIYAFINRADTAHYVRLEKAFLEPGGNAQAIAQISDSLYYDDDEINLNLILGENTFPLERVDGNAEGYVRDDGIFAQAPNYLYKIEAADINLQGGEELTIELRRDDATEPMATATTIVLDSIDIRTSPPGNPLKVQYGRDITWLWRVSPAARLFEVRMVFNYLERAPGTSDFLPKSVDWVIEDELVRTDLTTERVTVEFDGEQLYQFLGGAIEADGSVRQLTSMELHVAGVGEELVGLLEIERANAGITSAQATPIYTNVEGGIGVFTSRSRSAVVGLTLDPISVDSLQDGIYTRDLNFFQ